MRPNARKTSDDDPDELPVTLAAYVNGDRCMVQIASTFSAARQAWLDSITLLDDDGNPVLDENDRPRLVSNPDMWSIFLATALHVVIPGLTGDEAAVMAHDEPSARGLLEELGWLRRRTDEPSEDASRPEAGGGETTSSTGAVSSPASASTTPARTGTNA